jgi:hypothetical protein
MEHAQFVDAWTSGALRVSVDRSKALSVAGSNRLPRPYLMTQLFWIWLSLLTMIAGIVSMFWLRWWIGLAIVVVGRVLFAVTKKSATQVIIRRALQDPDFYRFALERGILRWRAEG